MQTCAIGCHGDGWREHPSGVGVSLCARAAAGKAAAAAGVHSRPSFVPVLWKKHCKGGGGEKERTARFSGEDIMIENYVEMITEHAASHCSGYIMPRCRARERESAPMYIR
jgi:hypothetical protein